MTRAGRGLRLNEQQLKETKLVTSRAHTSKLAETTGFASGHPGSPAYRGAAEQEQALGTPLAEEWEASKGRQRRPSREHWRPETEASENISERHQHQTAAVGWEPVLNSQHGPLCYLLPGLSPGGNVGAGSQWGGKWGLDTARVVSSFMKMVVCVHGLSAYTRC